jgi:hypothetical protein
VLYTTCSNHLYNSWAPDDGHEQQPAARTHNLQSRTRPTACKLKCYIPHAAIICIILQLLMMGMSNIPQPGRITYSPRTRPTCKPKSYIPQAATISTIFELLMMGIIVPETCWADNKFVIKLPCCIQLAFIPRINDDAQSNSHQVYNFRHWATFVVKSRRVASECVQCTTFKFTSDSPKQHLLIAKINLLFFFLNITTYFSLETL